MDTQQARNSLNPPILITLWWHLQHKEITSIYIKKEKCLSEWVYQDTGETVKNNQNPIKLEVIAIFIDLVLEEWFSVEED